MFSRAFLSLFVLLQFAVAQKCPLQFDGRVPAGSTPASFDTSTSKFNPSNVFGKGLSWSKIVQLPATATSSLFDANSTISVEVTISDSSIFNSQTGFRRAELLPASNSGSDPSTQGIKTLHFSLQQDTNRPLNFSHEYQLVFLETADFSTNQFALKTGAISGHAGQGNNRLVLQSNVRNPTDLHAVSFTAGVWHNYAITLDFTANTVQVFYSQGNSALAAVTSAVSNDVSGQGQFHFGVLKKPTGDGLTDITKQGFQENGISEGIIFGGIFEEDSSSGCSVSLSP